jgi:hypothetical protein
VALNSGVNLMPSGSSPIHSSITSRPIYVLSILLVFFYILFDVLDLDGSSFPRRLTPVKRTVIVAIVPSGTQLNYYSAHSKLCDDIALLFADRSGLNVRPLRTEVSSSSRLGTARSHGYRVGLARNSLPDSSAYW